MLCQFAKQFPDFVADFLDRSRSLRRRFREESVTDLLMASLITIGGNRVYVEFPNEPVTGADMEWNFVNWDDGSFYRLRIQAKKLYGTGRNWKRHSYTHLLALSPSKRLQVETLCDSARRVRAYPLYIFYNAQDNCQMAWNGGLLALRGINVADGYRIRALARRGKKNLHAVHPLLQLLSLLFCPPHFGGVPISPPRPVDIYERLQLVRFGPPPEPYFVDEAQVREDMSDDDDMPAIPEVSNTIPQNIRAALDRRRSTAPRRRPARLNHWRAIFISGNLAD
jgi:hypothetical protein